MSGRCGRYGAPCTPRLTGPLGRAGTQHRTIGCTVSCVCVYAQHGTPATVGPTENNDWKHVCLNPGFERRSVWLVGCRSTMHGDCMVLAHAGVYRENVPWLRVAVVWGQPSARWNLFANGSRPLLVKLDSSHIISTLHNLAFLDLPM